jgi:hypothetical protein
LLERTKLIVNCGPIHSYLRLTAHTHGQIASGQGGCHQQDPFLSHLTLTLIYSHSLDHFPLLLSIELQVVLLSLFDGTIPRRRPQNAITSTLGSILSPPNTTSAGALRSNNTTPDHTQQWVDLCRVYGPLSGRRRRFEFSSSVSYVDLWLPRGSKTTAGGHCQLRE